MTTQQAADRFLERHRSAVLPATLTVGQTEYENMPRPTVGWKDTVGGRPIGAFIVLDSWPESDELANAILAVLKQHHQMSADAVKRELGYERS